MTGDGSINHTGLFSLSTTGVVSGTYTKVQVDAKGRVTSTSSLVTSDITTALAYSPLNKAGDVMTGTLGLYAISGDPSTAGWNATQKGYTWFDTATNTVKYWDGSTVQSLGVAGSGLTSIANKNLARD